MVKPEVSEQDVDVDVAVQGQESRYRANTYYVYGMGLSVHNLIYCLARKYPAISFPHGGEGLLRVACLPSGMLLMQFNSIMLLLLTYLHNSG